MPACLGRRYTAQLAVLSRPAYRCIRADSEPVAGQVKFRLPAEWEQHEATWLAWPHEKSDWPGKFAPIPWIYAQIVGHLARVEKVRILVEDSDTERRARRALKQ